MCRRLSTLCSAASLLLCVAVCVLWMRSCWRTDSLSLDGRHTGPDGIRTRGLVWRSAAGGLYVAGLDVTAVVLTDDPRFRPPDQPWRLLRESGAAPVRSLPENPSFDRFGLAWGGGWRRPGSDRYYRGSSSEFFLGFPHRLAAVVTLATPACHLARRSRRRRRGSAGLYVRCGYDLRATPARCPECGAAGAMPASPLPQGDSAHG